MADNSKINVRNVYIELLNKMKAIEGVDIEYINRLVQLLYDDINLIDIDVQTIKDLIPNTATTTNQLATMSDLPAAQVNSDWSAITGVASILHKPAILNPHVVNAVKGPAQWVSGTDYYTCDINFGTLNLDTYIPPIVWCTTQTGNIEPSATETANYNLIVACDWYYDDIEEKHYCRLYARSGAVPTGNISIGVIGYYYQ